MKLFVSDERFLLLFLILVCSSTLSCSEIKRDYKKAYKINTIDAYNNFINKYPEDDLAGKAKEHIRSLTPLSSLHEILDAMIMSVEPYSSIVTGITDTVNDMASETASSLYNRIDHDTLAALTAKIFTDTYKMITEVAYLNKGINDAFSQAFDFVNYAKYNFYIFAALLVKEGKVEIGIKLLEFFLNGDVVLTNNVKSLYSYSDSNHNLLNLLLNHIEKIHGKIAKNLNDLDIQHKDYITFLQKFQKTIDEIYAK